MKLKILVAAVAAVTISAASHAQVLNETGGVYQGGAVPVGVVGTPILVEALQAAQFGADSFCVGNNTETCMPSISTTELSSVLHAGFGEEWGDYGISALGTGAIASTAVCGTITGDDVTRVGARHIGFGCTTGNPDAQFNSIIGLFSVDQSDKAGCMAASQASLVGAIAFAEYDETDANYANMKLDGVAATAAQFNAGNYNMFGDVHGAPAANQINGVAIHAAAGSFVTSSECAAGRLFSGAGDLAN